MPELLRKGHFLGAKLRTLRKRNGLTLEELSVRCMERDTERAPSVSYLSMIESGKRTPSPELLDLLAGVFQRPVTWFLDESADLELPPALPGGAAARVPLEPAFLFSKSLLQAAIPELLVQTGTTGRQFAHLLIRSHQEMSRNDFPDLERAADGISERRFPLAVEDLMRLCKRHGLEIRWFDRKPVLARDKDRELRSMVRSFFEAPRIIYANRALQADPARLKFDLAAHIAHKVLHGGDGLKSAHATGGEMGGSPESGSSAIGMSAQDVLHAWRDFECSFFAGALLAPRVPFRRFLARERHRVEAGAKLQLTPAVIMRRMTKVSPYPYWHFFDAYPPGYLRAVYRGNGIPLPWGNLAQVSDPCPNWAVFRMIDSEVGGGSQISVLRDGERSLLYCCHSMRVHDMAGKPACPVRRGGPGAGAGRQQGGQRFGGGLDLPRVSAPPRRGAHSQGCHPGARGGRPRAEHRLDHRRAVAPGAHHLPAQQPLPARRTLRGCAALARARDRRRARGDPRP